MRSDLKPSNPANRSIAERRDLTRWRDHRLEKEAGRKTVANDLSTLAELFRWCVREKYLPDNPIDRITRSRFTIKKEGTPLIREQAGRWLRSIQPQPGRGARAPLTWEDVRRKRHIGVFLLNTGVRNGEFCTLDIDDVRVDEETQMLHVFGKGQKHRWVPLNRAALAAICLHLRSRGNPTSGPLVAVDVERSALVGWRVATAQGGEMQQREHQTAHDLAHLRAEAG